MERKIISVFFISAFFLLLGCTERYRTKSQTRVMFDTVVRITLVCDDSVDCAPIFLKAFNELDEWEKSLNPYDSSSALFSLNNSSGKIVVCEKLAKAIKTGLDALEFTKKNFDIRLGEIIFLWDFAGKGHIPTENELDSVIRLSKNCISIKGDTIFKNQIAPRIDLGGCAKGIALDAVCDILDSMKDVDRYLVDLGGNIRGGDRTGKSFKIGIRDPRNPEGIAGTFDLKPGFSCATSGDYQRYFVIDGVRYHHIMDPINGKPARKCSAVTVVAPNGYLADVFSTALFVMGPEDGIEFIKKDNNSIKAIFFDLDGKPTAGNLETK